MSALDLTSHDVEAVCQLTGLALATISLLLAGRSDSNSVSIFGSLGRRGIARGLLFGEDLCQEAADVGSGTRNVAEPRDGGELLHVDLGVQVNDVLHCVVSHTLVDDPYLGLRFHAAAVVAEQLHLTLGERAGGGGRAFRWHGCRGVLGWSERCRSTLSWERDWLWCVEGRNECWLSLKRRWGGRAQEAGLMKG